MKFKFKPLAIIFFVAFGLLISANSQAQSSSCAGTEQDKASCATNANEDDKNTASCGTKEESTSGCSPTACRGAKTKFGEAKVISALRLDLIALKADMEKSTKLDFDTRSYDIHNIIGETDDESLQIILKEVRIIESAFAEKLNYKVIALALPENKAKQVSYLSDRINTLKKTLLAKS